MFVDLSGLASWSTSLPSIPQPAPAAEDGFSSTRSSNFWRDNLTTGWTFGRGGDLSVRVYDKTAELGFRLRESAASARLANEKRAQEAEIWQGHGWTEGEPVARVEVQARGTALAELCDRCTVEVADVDPEHYEQALEEACEQMAREVARAVDGIWQYATRKWLRQVDRAANPRATRCPVTAWWRQVQAVQFCGEAEPCKRVRKRTCARSAQALGCVLSLIAMHGHHSPWVDTRQREWKLPDEKKAALHLEAVGLAHARLQDEVARACELAAPIILHDLLAHAGSTRAALERLIVRWSAVSARFQPGEQERIARAMRQAPVRHLARAG